MIVSTSHLGVTCDILKLDKELERLDFKRLFYKTKVPNSIKKKIFLKNYSKFHDILFLKNKNWNFGLELIQYKKMKKDLKLNLINGKELKDIQFKDINKIKKITLFSSKINHDYSLLKELNILNNFKFSKDGILGELPSFNNSKIKLYIKKKIKKKYFLDDMGFNFVSFFTTNINDEINKLKKRKIKSISKIINIAINKKRFKLILFRTLGGLIFELLEKYEK